MGGDAWGEGRGKKEKVCTWGGVRGKEGFRNVWRLWVWLGLSWNGLCVIHLGRGGTYKDVTRYVTQVLGAGGVGGVYF